MKLGIFFSYFICISCVIVIIRDCERIDIPFLSIETNKNIIKNITYYINETTNETMKNETEIITVIKTRRNMNSLIFFSNLECLLPKHSLK